MLHMRFVVWVMWSCFKWVALTLFENIEKINSLFTMSKKHTVNNNFNGDINIKNYFTLLTISCCKSYLDLIHADGRITIMIMNQSFTELHYSDIIMSAMAPQITSISIVCSTVCSGAESSASLPFVRGIHRWLVESPHNGPSNTKDVSIWWHHHRHHHIKLIVGCGLHYTVAESVFRVQGCFTGTDCPSAGEGTLKIYGYSISHKSLGVDNVIATEQSTQNHVHIVWDILCMNMVSYMSII